MASHRRPTPSSGSARTTRVSVLSAAAATAAAALSSGATPAGADPRGTPADVLPRVDRLYEQAERATEKYNAADERRDRLHGQVERIRDRVARGQDRVNRMRDGLAGLAGAQYRSGGLDPALALLLSEDPDGYLDKAATLGRIGHQQAVRLRALQAAQRSLRQQRDEAGHKLDELERSRAEVARHKKAVERRLAAAQRLLGALAPGERGLYDRASRSAGRGDEAFADLLGSGLGPSSARAAAAVAAARQAVGRPYVWGMAGPGGFDCSGLMQWAYAQAGVAIPRTSQGQRYAGRVVPVSAARPGDLITYRGDASHVGMYVGNGQVVHAPYPGARVRYDPVGMIPGAMATRV
ncbi:NlpC/P60 family protein [Streptomyces pathocidini]|uniref:NlpC/P60 family protein n=1 Tax=Streptomyces pathocidini TaxID=1650571 RepID=A0ABW7USA2_9ACTN|nr:C40 family peptidase [Streptomyces pathocidini]